MAFKRLFSRGDSSSNRETSSPQRDTGKKTLGDGGWTSSSQETQTYYQFKDYATDYNKLLTKNNMPFVLEGDDSASFHNTYQQSYAKLDQFKTEFEKTKQYLASLPIVEKVTPAKDFVKNIQLVEQEIDQRVKGLGKDMDTHFTKQLSENNLQPYQKTRLQKTQQDFLNAQKRDWAQFKTEIYIERMNIQNKFIPKR